MRSVKRGRWWFTSMPAVMGTASSASRLHQMPDGSIASSCSQPAVAGLVAIIQVKLKGVRKSASTAATAEMLTDSARLPRPK